MRATAQLSMGHGTYIPHFETLLATESKLISSTFLELLPSYFSDLLLSFLGLDRVVVGLGKVLVR
jgi:hypothetical protein